MRTYLLRNKFGHVMNHGLRLLSLLGCLSLIALVAGCDTPATPQFHLNMVQMVSDATPTPPDYQQQIANVLDAMFGTPDYPFALPETGLDARKLKMAAGPAWTDEKGTNFGLYRKHCVHCHGISGDGRGPTALFLNPYPRDYRQGVYKFKSTYTSARPTDDDLHRIMVNGVPGTAMPSFSLLSEAEIEALVEYVKYLSIRGQMETALTNFAFNDLGEEDVVDDNGEPVLDKNGEPQTRLIALDPEKDAEQRSIVMELLTEIVDEWSSVNEQIIVPDEEAIPSDKRSPEEVAESVAKGRELFYGVRANCVKCHGPTGLGDGQQDDFDNWNKAHKLFLDSLASGSDDEFAAQRTEVAASLYPVRNAIPRNLRQGIYRGGNRRIDVYWRIYAGIAGTPMPGSGPASPGAQGTLTEEEMWNIVDYVLSLPYEMPSRPLRALPANVKSVN
jgi:mono/diheme cytochrome c family protein